MNAGISAVDKAYALHRAGKPEDSARLAVAILEGDPSSYDAAALVAQLLVEANRGSVATGALPVLVEALANRGDLPAAAGVLCVARNSKVPVASIETKLADTFAKNSSRLGDVSPPPPPLPKPVREGADLKTLSGDALWSRAEAALTATVDVAKKQPANGRVPRWPLFSELRSTELKAFLETLTILDAAEDEHVVKQGEAGSEAFVVVRGVAKVTKTVDGQETVLAALGPGAIFGEMALVTDTPRAASVVAVEGVRLLVLSRPALERLATLNPAVGERLGEFCHQRMLANLMRTSPVFSALDPQRRDSLANKFSPRSFDAGQTIIRRGEPPTSVYVIASGSVGVVAIDEEGESVHVTTLGPGDVLGEIGMILRKPATADAVAAHATVALELKQAAFEAAIADFPELLQKLYPIAVKRDDQTRSILAQSSVEAADVDILV